MKAAGPTQGGLLGHFGSKDTARCFITNSWQVMVGVGSARKESQPGGITSDAEAHFDCVVASICRDVGISCHELEPRDTEPRVRQRCRGRCRRLSLRRDDSRPRCKCPIQLCRFACDIAEGSFGMTPEAIPRWIRGRVTAFARRASRSKLAQNPDEIAAFGRLSGPTITDTPVDRFAASHPQQLPPPVTIRSLSSRWKRLSQIHYDVAVRLRAADQNVAISRFLEWSGSVSDRP